MPHQTAAEIVAKVNRLLKTSEGQARVSRLHNTLKTMLVHANSVRASLRLVRSRSTASFYTNASKASPGPPILSVRVGGVECGELLLLNVGPTGKRQRLFRPTNVRHFSSCRHVPKSGLDWADRAVREYLVSAGAKVRDLTVKRLANRESVIEADLLKAMMKRRPSDRQDALAEHQPVLYPLRGLPFQFPMPIGARVSPTLGEGAGHIDILARAGRGGRCLRVFEVKRPNANDVGHALNQAVAYCAAVHFLLTESPQVESESLYKALGFRQHPARAPRVEAVAAVKDTPANRKRISTAAAMLVADSSSPFALFALFYTNSTGRTSFGPIVALGSRL